MMAGLRFRKERLIASPGVSHVEIDFGGEAFALHRFGRPPYTFNLSNIGNDSIGHGCMHPAISGFRGLEAFAQF